MTQPVISARRRLIALSISLGDIEDENPKAKSLTVISHCLPKVYESFDMLGLRRTSKSSKN